MVETDKQLIHHKTELEVMVENFKEAIQISAKKDVDIETINVQSDERIKTKYLNYTFFILMSILGIGTIFGIIMLIKGNFDLGISLIRDVIIGGFAFLAGKAFGVSTR